MACLALCRKQGRPLLVPQSRRTRSREVCKGVRCYCFSGATTVISVSTKREPWALCVPQLPLRHSTPVPHYPLGRVVRRLDAFQRHARPQRRTQLEARPTDARGLRGATRAAGFEPLFDLSTQRTPNAPQARPLQWPIVDAMPPGKPLTPWLCKASPISWKRPPRPIIASMSRNRCAPRS